MFYDMNVVDFRVKLVSQDTGTMGKDSTNGRELPICPLDFQQKNRLTIADLVLPLDKFVLFYMSEQSTVRFVG